MGLQDLEDFIGQRLQNGAGRIGQRRDKCRERGRLLVVFSGSLRTSTQLLGPEDRIQGRQFTWNRPFKWNISGIGMGSHVSPPAAGRATSRLDGFPRAPADGWLRTAIGPLLAAKDFALILVAGRIARSTTRSRCRRTGDAALPPKSQCEHAPHSR